MVINFKRCDRYSGYQVRFFNYLIYLPFVGWRFCAPLVKGETPILQELIGYFFICQYRQQHLSDSGRIGSSVEMVRMT
ncbi:hypothetical protein NSTC745_06584 [Nostoc sp. DSM 114161]|jgi:hypothetical protein|uniref:hypothetical protein n=1 Tax=Nostoc sp. DSM 114161 TaxID=3440143 RepID=UPI00404573ED